jgi:hypothetical protein
VVKDAETGLWLKTRPDYLRLGLALDYKTTRVTSREAWRRQAVSLCYNVSAAFCIDVMRELDEKRELRLRRAGEVAALLRGRARAERGVPRGRPLIYRKALRTFADCYAKNDWPGYPDVETIEMPAWAARQLAGE